MRKEVRFETDLKITDEPVDLTLEVNQPQMIASRVKVGSKLVAIGDVKDVRLGAGADLMGKKLNIKSLVSDWDDETNYTEVVYRFRMGDETKGFTLSADAENDGDAVIYRVTINLV